jgi:hypothetical protein
MRENVCAIRCINCGKRNAQLRSAILWIPNVNIKAERDLDVSVTKACLFRHMSLSIVSQGKLVTAQPVKGLGPSTGE